MAALQGPVEDKVQANNDDSKEGIDALSPVEPNNVDKETSYGQSLPGWLREKQTTDILSKHQSHGKYF